MPRQSVIKSSESSNGTTAVLEHPPEAEPTTEATKGAETAPESAAAPEPASEQETASEAKEEKPGSRETFTGEEWDAEVRKAALAVVARIDKTRMRLTEAQAELEEAKGNVKAAEKVLEEQYRELRDVVKNGPEKGLFDAGLKSPPVEQGAAPESDPEAWRAVSIGELEQHGKSLGPTIVKLGEAGVRTLGDLSEWTATKKLTDVKGIGQAKAEAIEAALDKYWAANPREATAGQDEPRARLTWEEESDGWNARSVMYDPTQGTYVNWWVDPIGNGQFRVDHELMELKPMPFGSLDEAKAFCVQRETEWRTSGRLKPEFINLTEDELEAAKQPTLLNRLQRLQSDSKRDGLLAIASDRTIQLHDGEMLFVCVDPPAGTKARYQLIQMVPEGDVEIDGPADSLTDPYRGHQLHIDGETYVLLGVEGRVLIS